MDKRNTNKSVDQFTQTEVQESDPAKTNHNEECPGQEIECMLSSSPTESVEQIQNEEVPKKGIDCMLSPSPSESLPVNIIDNKVSVIRFLHDGIVTDGIFYMNCFTGLPLIFDLINSSTTTRIAAIG